MSDLIAKDHPHPVKTAEPEAAEQSVGKTPLLTLAKIAVEQGESLAPAVMEQNAGLFEGMDPDVERAVSDRDMVFAREEHIGGHPKRIVTVYVGPEIPAGSDNPDRYVDYPKIIFYYRPDGKGGWMFYTATVGLKGWEIGTERIKNQFAAGGTVNRSLIDRDNYLEVSDIEKRLGRYMPQTKGPALNPPRKALP